MTTHQAVLNFSLDTTHLFFTEIIHRKACQVLTRLGSDVNTRDSDRWTPLMWAARSGCDKTSQALLDKQAILDHVNNRGDTALHIASSHGKVRVVELLLNVGANVCLRNSQGQSCLDVAVLSGAGDVALAIAQNKRLVAIFWLAIPLFVFDLQFLNDCNTLNTTKHLCKDQNNSAAKTSLAELGSITKIYLCINGTVFKFCHAFYLGHVFPQCRSGERGVRKITKKKDVKRTEMASIFA